MADDQVLYEVLVFHQFLLMRGPGGWVSPNIWTPYKSPTNRPLMVALAILLRSSNSIFLKLVNADINHFVFNQSWPTLLLGPIEGKWSAMEIILGWKYFNWCFFNLVGLLETYLPITAKNTFCFEAILPKLENEREMNM